MINQPVQRSVVALALLTLLLVSGCALTDLAVPSPAFPPVVLPGSASTFDHNSLVGQTAPAFALPDATNQPYTFAPTDGHKHIIVFYMAYT